MKLVVISCNTLGKYFLLLFGLLLVSAVQNACGQYKISGTVINGSNHQPVSAASVLISNSTIGAATDDRGKFILNSIKSGDYTLVVNALGYELFTLDVHINNADVVLPAIQLEVKATTLQEVKVSASSVKNGDYEWAYQAFLSEFLGTSDIAKDCKIINPEVLNLDYDLKTNTVNASSDDFLHIKNDDLGYIIQYKLNDFKLIDEPQNKSIHYEGVALFTKMKGSLRQQRRWEQNRQLAYEGSFMHFLRALLNDQLYKEGFKVLKIAFISNPNKPAATIISAKINHFKSLISNGEPLDINDSLAYWNKKAKLPDSVEKLFPNPLGRNDLLTATNNPSIFNLSSHNNDILIMYDRNHDFPQTSRITDLSNLNFLLNKADNYNLTLVTFNEPFAVITSNGGLINPNSLQLTGGLINKRVGDLLPIDYAEQNSIVVKPDTVLQNVVAKINRYTRAYPWEKVYLHVDRDTYAPGDTVWFKAYAVSGPVHQPSLVSSVLHCELVNEKDSVIESRILKITNGLAEGDFDIYTKAGPGNYKIVAYTNWMRNAGADFFFTKNINIIDTRMTSRNPSQQMHMQPDAQFFPEGGDMIAGIENKVAVKIVNSNGLGENALIKITDNAGKQVANFTTRHLGMGSFTFTPIKDKTYKATVTCVDSSKYTYELPKVKNEGFTLSAYRGQDSIYIRLATNAITFESQKNNTFYLLVQEEGKLYSSIPASLTKPELIVSVEKKQFLTGIIQITLMSAKEELLNERLIFVRNNDIAAINLTSDSKIYSARQKVKIDMNVNTNGWLLPGNYSVSVVNDDRAPVSENAGDNILSNLLMTSDLAGYVEQPGYYFEHANNETDTDLDLLMLTQGYRRFEWKNALSPLTASFVYKPENSLSLSGFVKTANGKPAAFSKVTLIASTNNYIADTISDAKGNFAFNNLNFSDSTNLVIKTNKANGGESNLRIAINRPGISAPVKMLKLQPVFWASSQAMTNLYKDYGIRLNNDLLIKGRMLQEVKVKEQASYAPNDPRAAPIKAGVTNQIIMGDQLVGCVNFAGCISGLLNTVGVKIVNGAPYSTRSLGTISNQSASGEKSKGEPSPVPMAVIVDNQVITSYDMNDINPEEIYSIEVMKSKGFAGPYDIPGYRGAIIITMKNGSEHKKSSDVTAPGLTTHYFEGYYKARIFYSPKYDAGKNQRQLPDARTTIYWNPNIVIGTDGKTSFDFYNADTKGTYRVIVEGMDMYGNPGRQVYRYQVK